MSTTVIFNKPQPQQPAAFAALGVVLDRRAHQWLLDTEPEVIDAMRLAIAGGGQPDAIKRYIIDQHGRREFAIQCEAAARHIQRINERIS